MKVLVYGKEPLVKRVSENLTGQGIEAAAVTSRTGFETAFSPFEKPDVVIIDREVGDAAGVSGYSHDTWKVCTVLMTEAAAEDWENLARFSVDGYVYDRFYNSELKARLAAVYRRVNPAVKEVA